MTYQFTVIHNSVIHMSGLQDYETFKAVSEQVKRGSLEVNEGLEQVKELKYNDFDMDEIKAVQEATWLPDDFAVSIMKGWMRQQDQLLLQLRANLVLTPEISKQRLIEFATAVRRPSTSIDLRIENIIEKIATAGGTRKYINPMTNGLITVESLSDSSKQENKLTMLFEEGIENYFVSASQQGQWIIIGLPPFLRLQVTSYTLGAPPEKQNVRAQGGLASWHLQGSNDKEQYSTTIDNVNDNKDLAEGGAVHTFKVPIKPNQPVEFFRYFKLTQTSSNHQLNGSIYLSKIDFSGNLIISRD